MERKSKFPPELRERAVRRVRDTEGQYESRWAAMQSVADEVGCTTETLRQWLHETERTAAPRASPPTASPSRVGATQRGNEILRRLLAQFDRAELQRSSK